MFFLSFRQALICNPQKELRREDSSLVDRSVLTCGASRKGPRGTGRDRVWLYVSRSWVLSLSARIGIFKSTFSPLSQKREHLFPLCLFVFFNQISIKSREACISVFLQLFVPFGPRCLPNMKANLALSLVHMHVGKSRRKSPG